MALLVNLKVLVPFLNLSGGGGDARGSLKKNDPNTSPTESVINLIFATVATAPLVRPTKVFLR